MVTNIGCAKRAQKFLEVRALLVVTRELCWLVLMVTNVTIFVDFVIKLNQKVNS